MDLLTILVNDNHISNSNYNYLVLISADIEKAYSNVNHKILPI